MDGDAVDIGIRPRKIDILEDTERGIRRADRLMGLEPRTACNDDLARSYIPHELRADGVKRAGFRGDDICAFKTAQRERAHAFGIAHADDLILCQEDERIAALEPLHRERNALDKSFLAVSCDERRDDLRVDGGLKANALRLQLLAQLFCVDDISVVRQCERAERGLHHERLRVDKQAVSRGRIPHVPDGKIAALERAEAVVKAPADETHRLVAIDSPFARNRNARALLPAMLQRKQAVIRGLRRVQPASVCIDAEHAAFFMHAVVVRLEPLVWRRQLLWQTHVILPSAG